MQQEKDDPRGDDRFERQPDRDVDFDRGIPMGAPDPVKKKYDRPQPGVLGSPEPWKNPWDTEGSDDSAGDDE